MAVDAVGADLLQLVAGQADPPVVVQRPGHREVGMQRLAGLHVVGAEAAGRVVVLADPRVHQPRAEFEALGGLPGEGVVGGEDPDVAAGVDRGIVVVVAGGQAENEVQALPVRPAEQGNRRPLQHQRGDHQVALAGARAVRAAVDVQVEVHQRQQHFRAVVRTEQGVLADPGEVRQQRGAVDSLFAGHRVTTRVHRIIGAVMLDGQLEEHARPGDAIEETGVAQLQRWQADAVGPDFQAKQQGQDAKQARGGTHVVSLLLRVRAGIAPALGRAVRR
ncbi:hypothetical protein D3C78_1076220 [compost metagenome]